MTGTNTTKRPIGEKMRNPFSDDSEEEQEEEYVCKGCGEEWEGEATAFYVEGRCKNCGAPGSSNKIIKNRDNPLTREGENDE